MKSGLCAVTVLFCMLFPALAAHSSGLFVPPGQTIVSAPGAHSGPEVLRQRIARLDPDKLLDQSNVESIELQLFDNIYIKALQKEEQKDPGGFLLWTGEIEGVEGGKMVLVVRNGLIFASVYLPSSIVQIRPVQMAAGPQDFQGTDGSQDYIVRELAYPWRTGGTARGSGNLKAGSTSDAKRLVELVNLREKQTGFRPLNTAAS